MSVWTRGRLDCQHLLIREHFDSRRSDVSQTGHVQANGEVHRPANGARNKVMIFLYKKKEGLCHKTIASRRNEKVKLTKDARNAGRWGSGERRLECGWDWARRVERAEGDGARADAAGDGGRG